MEHVIEKRIHLSAPVPRVWKALTDSREFGAWFRVKFEAPFIAGHSLSGHITFPGYEHLRMDVVVKTIQPTSYFSYTWHPYAIDPQADYTQEVPTLVEFRLQEDSGGTLLTVTESGFDQLPPERYADAFRMNSRGWEQQLENMSAYVGHPA